MAVLHVLLALPTQPRRVILSVCCLPSWNTWCISNPRLRSGLPECICLWSNWLWRLAVPVQLHSPTTDPIHPSGGKVSRTDPYNCNYHAISGRHPQTDRFLLLHPDICTRNRCHSGYYSRHRAGPQACQLQGPFYKRTSVRPQFLCVPPSLTVRVPVKNLMYGFGDDRNPATDTVNVMEEILVEFIVDVVRSFGWLANHFTTRETVPNCRGTTTEEPIVHRGPAASFIKACRCKKACSNGRTTVHAGGYQTCPRAVRRIRHESPKRLLNPPRSIRSLYFIICIIPDVHSRNFEHQSTSP